MLFIPYSSGFVLLADKQNTVKGTSEKQEVEKLFLYAGNGPALGCAGHTLFIKKLYSLLKEETLAQNQNSCDIIKRKLFDTIGLFTKDATAYGPRLEEGELRTEALLLQRINGTFSLTKLIGLVDYPLDLSHIQAVPELSPEALRYLEVRTSDLSQESAIAIGEEILRQNAFYNYKIGPPEYHGYDLIKIDNQGAFSFCPIKRTLGVVNADEILDFTLKKKERKD